MDARSPEASDRDPREKHCIRQVSESFARCSSPTAYSVCTPGLTAGRGVWAAGSGLSGPSQASGRDEEAKTVTTAGGDKAVVRCAVALSVGRT